MNKIINKLSVTLLIILILSIIIIVIVANAFFIPKWHSTNWFYENDDYILEFVGSWKAAGDAEAHPQFTKHKYIFTLKNEDISDFTFKIIDKDITINMNDCEVNEGNYACELYSYVFGYWELGEGVKCKMDIDGKVHNFMLKKPTTCSIDADISLEEGGYKKIYYPDYNQIFDENGDFVMCQTINKYGYLPLLEDADILYSIDNHSLEIDGKIYSFDQNNKLTANSLEYSLYEPIDNKFVIGVIIDYSNGNPRLYSVIKDGENYRYYDGNTFHSVDSYCRQKVVDYTVYPYIMK